MMKLNFLYLSPCAAVGKVLSLMRGSFGSSKPSLKVGDFVEFGEDVKKLTNVRRNVWGEKTASDWNRSVIEKRQFGPHGKHESLPAEIVSGAKALVVYRANTNFGANQEDGVVCEAEGQRVYVQLCLEDDVRIWEVPLSVFDGQKGLRSAPSGWHACKCASSGARKQVFYLQKTFKVGDQVFLDGKLVSWADGPTVSDEDEVGSARIVCCVLNGGNEAGSKLASREANHRKATDHLLRLWSESSAQCQERKLHGEVVGLVDRETLSVQFEEDTCEVAIRLLRKQGDGILGKAISRARNLFGRRTRLLYDNVSMALRVMVLGGKYLLLHVWQYYVIDSIWILVIKRRGEGGRGRSRNIHRKISNLYVGNIIIVFSCILSLDLVKSSLLVYRISLELLK